MFFQKYKFHFLLVIVTSVLILGLDIALTSLFKHYKSFNGNRKLFRIKHPIYHHGFTPMINGIDHYGPIEYRFITNSLGFKDKICRQVKRMSPKKRILFAGDSFVEGVGLKYEETFVGLVHNKINKDFDVLNAGRVSFCPYLSFLSIKDLIQEQGYEIDEAFVFIDVSDAFDELFRYLYHKFKNNLMPDTTRYNQNKYFDSFIISKLDKENNVSFINRLSSQLKEILKEKTTVIYPVLNFVHDFNFSWQASKVLKNDEERLFDYYKEKNDKSPYQGEFYHVGWIPEYRDIETWSTKPAIYEEWGKLGLDESKRYMDSIKVFCDSRNIKLNIGIYPYPNEIWNIMPSKSYNEKYWVDYAKDNKIPLLNIYDDFRQRLIEKDKKLFIQENYIPNDVHFNLSGNEKIADYLIKKLGY